jgi:hypothetical protein
MYYNTFFDLYSSYMFIPIYFLTGLIFKLSKMYKDEVYKLLDYNNELEPELELELKVEE